MMDLLLDHLDRLLTGLAFPADKDELLAHLAAHEAGPELCWLVAAMPGTEFQFATDVLSTARLALEMDIQRPWPDHATPPAEYNGDQAIAERVRQRLRVCGETNAYLIRVTVKDGKVYLDGRTPDVPRGVMATRAATGVVPQERVVNRLQVTS